MDWNLQEALAYYKKQGAPQDQNALVSLLKEIQETLGQIPKPMLGDIAAEYGIRESLLLAIIRRLPKLRLADTHLLELCAGPNCSKNKSLAAAAEKLCSGKNVTLKFVPCMRMCGKGPNLKWDGTLYHQASEALLRELIDQI